MVNIVGTWRLVSFESRREDGKVVYPFGEDAVGYGIITEEGFFMASIMRANRKNFASGDFMGGTTEEKVSVAESFFSYCGRYELEGNAWRTHVEMCSFPNWVGGIQERFIEIEDDRFIARTPPMLIGGVKVRNYLIWERVKQS